MSKVYKIELNIYEEMIFSQVKRIGTRKYLMGLYARLLLIDRDNRLKNINLKKLNGNILDGVAISVRDLAMRYSWRVRKSYSTIYNNIKKLIDLGLIEMHIEPGDTTARYTFNRLPQEKVEEELVASQSMYLEEVPVTSYSYKSIDEEIIMGYASPNDYLNCNTSINSIEVGQEKSITSLEGGQNHKNLKEYTSYKIDLSIPQIEVEETYDEYIYKLDKLPNKTRMYVLVNKIAKERFRFPVNSKTIKEVRERLGKYWSKVTTNHVEAYIYNAIKNQLEENTRKKQWNQKKANTIKAATKTKNFTERAYTKDEYEFMYDNPSDPIC